MAKRTRKTTANASETTANASGDKTPANASAPVKRPVAARELVTHGKTQWCVSVGVLILVEPDYTRSRADDQVAATAAAIDVFKKLVDGSDIAANVFGDEPKYTYPSDERYQPVAFTESHASARKSKGAGDSDQETGETETAKPEIDPLAIEKHSKAKKLVADYLGLVASAKVPDVKRLADTLGLSTSGSGKVIRDRINEYVDSNGVPLNGNGETIMA